MSHGVFSVVASEVFMGLLMDGDEDVTEVLLDQFDEDQLTEIIDKAQALSRMAYEKRYQRWTQ